MQPRRIFLGTITMTKKMRRGKAVEADILC